MMKMLKFTLLGAGLLLGLSACSEQSPLKTKPPEKAAAFLVKASRYAEKQIGHFQPPGGKVYGICMQGKADVIHVDCTKLYQAMVQYAHTQADFKGLTVKQLTNAKTWQRLGEDYQRQAFDQI